MSNARNRLVLARCVTSLVLVFSVTPLEAQAVRGTILVVVTDSTGAALPGATVELKHVATGVVQHASTDREGRYRAPDLPLGVYEVRASRAGFQTLVREGLTLHVGDQIEVPLSLAVTPIVMNVRGVAGVDTMSSALSTVIEQAQISGLPLLGRNFAQLISLAPGANELFYLALSSFFGRQSNFTVSGARPEGQAFLLDGTSMAGFWNRGPGSNVLGTTLGVEAIAEFRTLTNTYSAQFGGNGAVVNIATKSGTNQWQGTMFEFWRNAKLDAANYFDTLGKQPFSRHQFGGSAGGPLRKSRAFLFVTYEGLRQDRGETRIATVPDDNARLGLVNGNVVDVPLEIQSIIEIYPKATTIRSDGIGQVAQTAASTGYQDHAFGRLDYTPTDGTRMFLRYVIDTARAFDAFAGSNIPKWGADEHTNNQYLTGEVRRTVTDNLVNQTRFGMVRTHEAAVTRDSVPALGFFPDEHRQNGRVIFDGDAMTGIGGSPFMPYDVLQKRWSVADDLYWNHGDHSVTIGAALEYTATEMNEPYQAAGIYTFASLAKFLENSPRQFVGALPERADAVRSLQELGGVLYANDDWRVTSTLRLNLGLRYTPARNPRIEGGVPGGPHQMLEPPFGDWVEVDRAFETSPHLKNFDPRIGFAYDPTGTGKTTIRGGWGVFHNPIGPRNILPNYVNTPPYKLSQETMPDFGSPFRKGATPQNNGVGVYYRTTTDPSIMQWNVNVQRQIRNYASVTIAYVGSRGVNLLRQIDLNPVQSQLRDGESVFGDPTGTRQARPLARQNRSFGSLTYNKADGWSRYHSLQTSLTRRFDHGLQAQVSYTLSRCTDLSSGTLGAADGGTPATNPYDPGYDQGPCAFDRTHNFRGSGIYALPFTGHALTRGWQMSAIVSAVSGRPFTPSIGFDRSGLLTANQRPNLVAGHTIDDVYTGNIAQWFDPAAFELPAVGTLGTVGRNTLRAPKFFTIDLAVTKSLTLKATSVELRVEAFNVTNHTNFNPPAANIFLVSPSEPSRPYSPTAGQITSALAPRQLQLAVKLTF